jgi:hypothetical protein
MEVASIQFQHAKGGPQALSSWLRSLRSSQPSRQHLRPLSVDVSQTTENRDMKRIQSRHLNIALVVSGVVFTMLAVASVAEGVWMDGVLGLVDPNTIIWGAVFLALGLWCGLGGWQNLRTSEGRGN